MICRSCYAAETANAGAHLSSVTLKSASAHARAVAAGWAKALADRKAVRSTINNGGKGKCPRLRKSCEIISDVCKKKGKNCGKCSSLEGKNDA